MECLIGIKGRDFVLMATDCVAGRSIIALKKGVLMLYSILRVMLSERPYIDTCIDIYSIHVCVVYIGLKNEASEYGTWPKE